MIMKMMSVDIETYSDRDIGDTGAYAYAESPVFSILLIGYMFGNEEEPTVIDLGGIKSVEEATDYIELMYPEFLEALRDPGVVKTAYNANFERTCLAHYWGEMDPDQWLCTMVLASTLGLPRSLEEAGKALGLAEDQQKLAAGKALIQYFCKPCKPTKSNGGRTRNLPSDAPEKWALFKKYNGQDVVAERSILNRLLKYRPTEFEQKLWSWDQRMNDRGVLLDIPFVKGILEYDRKNRERLLAEAQELTGLSNPNSLPQLKRWLNDNGLPMQSVTKETLEAALALQYLPDNVSSMEPTGQADGRGASYRYIIFRRIKSLTLIMRGRLPVKADMRTWRFFSEIFRLCFRS